MINMLRAKVIKLKENDNASVYSFGWLGGNYHALSII
tara:strand:+ start:4088 stop:4198 length:111 start_codon:yes stop_codon:yes gene_type:complete